MFTNESIFRIYQTTYPTLHINKTLYYLEISRKKELKREYHFQIIMVIYNSFSQSLHFDFFQDFFLETETLYIKTSVDVR